MELTPPPFQTIADGIEIDGRTPITLAELRRMIDGFPDDAIVWLGIQGKGSPVRPSKSVLIANTYVLIS